MPACRRIPNTQLDQRSSTQQAAVRATPDIDRQMAYCAWPPRKVLNCKVWWGCLGPRSPAALSNHTLTVVTEMPMEGAQNHPPKEDCIEQYGCAVEDKPSCKCKHKGLHGAQDSVLSLRTTAGPAMGSWEKPETHLTRLRDGVGNALLNLHMLGVQLPHQSILRRFWFGCSKIQPWSLGKAGCGFTSFLD